MPDLLPMFNRELSWLDYNDRVLAEAMKPATPLLEQLNFLRIVASNLDEFFMVRVAAVKAAILSGQIREEWAGMHPEELLAHIHQKVQASFEVLYHHVEHVLLPALASKGIELVPPDQWKPRERRWLERYFMEQVFPLLTPLRLEESYPGTGSLQMQIVFRLDKQEAAEQEPPPGRCALVQVPRNLDRFIVLPSDQDEPSESKALRIALLEDLILVFGHRLFPGHTVVQGMQCKINRDADFGVDEDREDDFLAAMEEVLTGRQNSTPVRLVFRGDDQTLVSRVMQSLGLGSLDVYHCGWPMDLGRITPLCTPEFYRQHGFEVSPDLFWKPWKPVRPHGLPESIFDWIDEKDRFINVPYESFDTIQRFIEEAAEDPQVLGIKMTLYRTSGRDSPIVHALMRAARAGKQVVAVIELKARFDEEKNISWASALEQAGAIVTYGVAHLKVHAKAALVIRRSREGGIRRYLHLSTGNYNERTAQSYVDFSILTANESLCTEIALFFNILTGYSSIQPLSNIAVAPFDLKKRLIALIDREAQSSTPETPGLIMAKVNALSDPDIIEALYRASQRGVRIFLNVRGICTLVPGVPRLSETIQVQSVLGRYLEHGRIIYFLNGGREELYLSSADWLQRNMDKRIELFFPVLDGGIKARCRQILELYFSDNSHSYRLASDGTWKQAEAESTSRQLPPVHVQDALRTMARRFSQHRESLQEVLQVRRARRS
ncbi:MAG: polyphosphate kinase 1 [Rectinemataceae bacterium]